MNWFKNFNIAIYFRFRTIMVYCEGETQITHSSALILMSIFHICVLFLITLVSKYFNLYEMTSSGSNTGKFLAGLSMLVLIGLNFVLFRNPIRFYVKNNSQTCINRYRLFGDIFIVVVIIGVILFAYMNDLV